MQHQSHIPNKEARYLQIEMGDKKIPVYSGIYFLPPAKEPLLKVRKQTYYPE